MKLILFCFVLNISLVYSNIFFRIKDKLDEIRITNNNYQHNYDDNKVVFVGNARIKRSWFEDNDNNDNNDNNESAEEENYLCPDTDFQCLQCITRLNQTRIDEVMNEMCTFNISAEVMINKGDNCGEVTINNRIKWEHNDQSNASKIYYSMADNCEECSQLMNKTICMLTSSSSLQKDGFKFGSQTMLVEGECAVKECIPPKIVEQLSNTNEETKSFETSENPNRLENSTPIPETKTIEPLLEEKKDKTVVDDAKERRHFPGSNDYGNQVHGNQHPYGKHSRTYESTQFRYEYPHTQNEFSNPQYSPYSRPPGYLNTGYFTAKSIHYGSERPPVVNPNYYYLAIYDHYYGPKYRPSRLYPKPIYFPIVSYNSNSNNYLIDNTRYENLGFGRGSEYGTASGSHGYGGINGTTGAAHHTHPYASPNSNSSYGNANQFYNGLNYGSPEQRQSYNNHGYSLYNNGRSNASQQFEQSYRGQGYGQRYANQGYGPNYNNQQFNQSYRSQGYGQSYNNQRYDQNYRNQEYGQSYSNKGYDQSYGRQWYNPSYSAQGFRQSYDNQGYGQNYGNQEFDHSYRGQGYNQSAGSQGFGQSYGNQRYGQNYRTQGYGQSYGNQAFGPSYLGLGYEQRSRNQEYNINNNQEYDQSYRNQGFNQIHSSEGQRYNQSYNNRNHDQNSGSQGYNKEYGQSYNPEYSRQRYDNDGYNNLGYNRDNYGNQNYDRNYNAFGYGRYNYGNENYRPYGYVGQTYNPPSYESRYPDYRGQQNYGYKQQNNYSRGYGQQYPQNMFETYSDYYASSSDRIVSNWSTCVPITDSCPICVNYLNNELVSEICKFDVIVENTFSFNRSGDLNEKDGEHNEINSCSRSLLIKVFRSSLPIASPFNYSINKRCKCDATYDKSKVIVMSPKSSWLSSGVILDHNVYIIKHTYMNQIDTERLLNRCA